MGRAERRMRKLERLEEQADMEAAAELAERAGLPPPAFGEDDEPVTREELDEWDDAETDRKGAIERNASAPDPWRRVRLGTVTDAARVFAVHWKTIELWRRKDGLPFFRKGGVIRYMLGDVLAWASAHGKGA